MEFIGRNSELAKLQRMFASEPQEVTLIYGRRRVGKSELIKHFLRNYAPKGIYYECKRTSEANNTATLAALIAEAYGFPPLAFPSFEALLDFLFARAVQEKTLLVLDEYTYLRETIPGLDSILQALIDKYADASKLKLILCGSFIDTMKELLFAHNPLYGRISLSIHLHPMDYYESALFYPSFSPEDKIRLYSVFGGIPYYNRLIEEGKSVRENIIALLASPGARLENEVLLYLHSELAKLNNANEVFESLARGFSKFSDILSQSHVSSSPALSEVLKKLMMMELVEKTAPINDPNNKKRAGYHIKDNLSRFYYRYLFRYASQLRIMEPETFYERYIADDFETAYVPQCFEEVCREYLLRQNLQGKITPPFDAIGKYYYDLPKERKNGEFDVVTHDERGYIFYAAKFRNTPITREMMEKELKQVNATGLYCYKYGFFSRSGFESNTREDVIIYTLDDLFAHS